MALSDVLTTVKELVLNPGQLMGDIGNREVYLKERFPTLSGDEVRDLAAIRPERLAIYSNSIFTAEASLLARYFPVTTFEIKRAISSVRQEKEVSLYEVAQLINTVAPWRGIHSASLGESLIAFIKNYPFPNVTEVEPVLEIASLELAILRIRKALNSELEPLNVDAIKEISALTVGDLLHTEFAVPDLVQGVEATWDIATFRSEVLADASAPKMYRLEAPEYLVASRAHDYGVQWVSVAKPIYDKILARRGHGGEPLEVLAQLFVETCQEQYHSESEQFGEFLALILSLLNVGVLARVTP